MLRVVTYNSRRGGGDRLPAITELLRALQPDAVALVEAPEQARVEDRKSTRLNSSHRL